MASPMRLNAALVDAAEREGAIQKRSIPKQIEFWAEIGKAVEHIIDRADVLAVTQGLKRIKLEPIASAPVDSGEVFNSVDTSRSSGTLEKEVTSAAVYYEASLNLPGFIDRVDSATGERQTGRFHNGEFKAQG